MVPFLSVGKPYGDLGAGPIPSLLAIRVRGSAGAGSRLEANTDRLVFFFLRLLVRRLVRLLVLVPEAVVFRFLALVLRLVFLFLLVPLLLVVVRRRVTAVEAVRLCVAVVGAVRLWRILCRTASEAPVRAMARLSCSAEGPAPPVLIETLVSGPKSLWKQSGQNHSSTGMVSNGGDRHSQ